MDATPPTLQPSFIQITPRHSTFKMDQAYFSWRLPGVPAISIRRDVMEGIHHEIQEAFTAVPRRGAEAGGLLVGRRSPDGLFIDDFEPIPSEHRYGPSYVLSEADREMYRESVEWFESGGHPGLSVLGFYRSHTRPGFGMDSQDQDLLSTLPDDSAILLIQPSRTGPAMADFFMRHNGRLERGNPLRPFPFSSESQAVSGDSEASSVAAIAEAEPEKELPAPPTAVEWPAPRPRLVAEPEPHSKPGWLWYSAAAVLGVVGGALGYLALHPESGASSPPAKSAISASQPAPPAAKPSAITPLNPASSAERIAEDPEAQIHALLDRWSAALRRGDAEEAARCYAPVVTTYFNAQDAGRDQVRRTIRQSLLRYGGLDIYRLSEIKITPVGADRAVVTFRKHWQTAGARKSAGEEQERLGLVRIAGAWQIASEKEEKVYWTRRPR